MRREHEAQVPRVIIHGGLRLLLFRLRFMLDFGRYFFHRKAFPLFRLLPLKSGALYATKVVHDIGIRKVAQFGDRYFSSLTAPHSPSPAFERMVAMGGLNVGAAGTPLKRQIDTVLLAITRRCDLHCQHCYEHHNVGPGDEVPLERLKEVLAEVQRHGASSVILTGGEPMNRFDDLLELVEFADKSLSDIHVHTSGHGVTPERAAALRSAGLTAAAVGLDDVDPARHDRIRARAGSHADAVRALRLFRDAGVFTYVNLCATPPLIRSGDLFRYAEFVRDLGVGFIQLLEPRPCGAYLDAPAEVLLTEADRAKLLEFFRQANTRRRYRGYPIVHYVAFAESPAQRGCMMGGLSHLHIDSAGNLTPCVFLPVTFGNIMEEDFETIYRRMRRAIPGPLHAECPSLQLHATLRNAMATDGEMPVPYQAIEQEWERMYQNGERSHILPEKNPRSVRRETGVVDAGA